MKERWSAMLISKRFQMLGLGIFLYFVGMYTLFGNPLNQRIEKLQHELIQVEQQTQVDIQKLRSLEKLKTEITQMQKRLLVGVKRFPDTLESHHFRKDVAEVGKRMGVTLRLWKPEQPLHGYQSTDSSTSILVRTEGSFHQTVQFLDEVLRIAWVQNIESLMIVRGKSETESPGVITDLTLKGLTPAGLHHVKQLLET